MVFNGSFLLVLRLWSGAQPESNVINFMVAFVEAMQLLGLVFSPLFNYNLPVVKEISYFVYAFSFPLYSRDFGPLPYTYYAIPFFITFAIVAGMYIFFCLFTWNPDYFKRESLTNSFSYAAHNVGWTLCIPIINMFLGAMCCKGSSLVNFPEAQCGSSLHIVFVIFGSIGIIAELLFGLLISISIGELRSSGRSFRARPHHYVEVYVFMVKAILCVLIHVLIPYNTKGTYGVIAAVVSLSALLVHVVLLPFYSQTATAVRCALFAAMTFTALLNAVTSFIRASFTEENGNSLVFATLVPISAVIGYFLSWHRVNEELSHKLSFVREIAVAPLHTSRLPFTRDLHLNELNGIPPEYRKLEDDILNNHHSSSPGLFNTGAPYDPLGARRSRAHYTCPDTWVQSVAHRCECVMAYINNVFLPFDGEIASRFILEWQAATGGTIPLTANQLIFGLRIHCKTMVLFRSSGYVLVHLANYIADNIHAFGFALHIFELVEREAHGEIDLELQVLVYHFSSAIKRKAGVQKEQKSAAVQRARAYHQETLMLIASFWHHLERGTSDVVVLCKLRDQMGSLRTRTLDEYLLVLSHKSETSIVGAISAFLKYAYSDEEAAEDVSDVGDEMASIEFNPRSTTSFLLMEELTEMVLGILRSYRQWIVKEGRMYTNGFTTPIKVLYVVLIFVVASSIATFTLSAYHTSYSKEMMGYAAFIGDSLFYLVSASLTTMRVSEFSLYNNCSMSTTKCTTMTEYAGYLAKLVEIANKMEVTFNRGAMFPHLNSMSKPSLTFLQETTLPVGFYPSGTRYLGSIFSSDDRNSTTFYGSLNVDEHMVANEMSAALSPYYLAAAITRLVAVAQKNEDFDTVARFIISDSSNPIIHGLLKYAYTLSDSMESTGNNIRNALIIVVALGLVVYMFVPVMYISDLVTYGMLNTRLARLIMQVPQSTALELYTGALNEITAFHGDGSEDFPPAPGTPSIPATPKTGYARVVTEEEMSVVSSTAGIGRSQSGGLVSRERSTEAVDVPLMLDANALARPIPRSPPLNERGMPAPHAGAGEDHPQPLNLNGQGRTEMLSFSKQMPLKSCIRVTRYGSQNKNAGSMFAGSNVMKNSATLPPTDRKVHFRPDQENHKSRYLKEPKLHLDSGKLEIMAEFEKTMRAMVLEETEENAANGPYAQEMRDLEKIVSVNKWTQNVNFQRFARTVRGSMTSPGWEYRCVLIPMFLLCTCGVIILSVIFYKQNVSGVAVGWELSQSTTVFINIHSSLSAFVHAAAQFANFGSMSSYNSVVSYAVVKEEYKRLVEISQNPKNAEVQVSAKLCLSAVRAMTRVVTNCMVACSLSARAFAANGDLSMSDVPVFATFRHPVETLTETVEDNLGESPDSPKQYLRPSLSTMPDNITPADLVHTADGFMSSDRSVSDITAARNAIAAAISDEYTVNLRDKVASASLQKRICVGITVAAGFGVVHCALTVAYLWFKKRKRGIREIFLIISAIMLLVAFAAGLSICIDKRYPLATVRKWHAAHLVVQTYQNAFYDNLMNVNRYVAISSGVRSNVVWASSPNSAFWATTLKNLRNALTSVGVSTSSVNDLEWDLENVWILEEIAMYLAYAASASNRNASSIVPPSPPFLIQYNFASETGHEADNITYANDHPGLQYGFSGTDLKNNATQMSDMARFALYGKRAVARFNVVIADLARIHALIDEVVAPQYSKSADRLINVTIVIISFASAAAFFGLAALLIPVASTSRMAFIKQYNECKRLVPSSHLPVFITVWAIAVLVMIVHFILAYVGTGSAVAGVNAVIAAHRRGSSAVWALSWVLYANRSATVDDAALVLTSQSRMTHALNVMTMTRSELYFSSDYLSNSYSGLDTMSARQKQILNTVQPGQSSSLDQLYISWMSAVQSASLVPLGVQLTHVYPGNPLKNSYGLTSAVKGSIQTYLTTLIGLESEVVRGLEESSMQYTTDIKKGMGRFIIPEGIMFAIEVLIAVLAMFFWLPITRRWTSRSISNTRVLLRMVPQAVYSTIPALAMYLQAGIFERVTVRSMQSLDPKAVEFVGLWKKTDSSTVGWHVCAVMDTSSVPLLVISGLRGNVRYANEAAMNVLGYRTLVSMTIDSILDPTSPLRNYAAIERVIMNAQPENIVQSDIVLRDCKDSTQHWACVIALAMDSGTTQCYIIQLTKVFPKKKKNKVAPKMGKRFSL